jgi:hypothetical protein
MALLVVPAQFGDQRTQDDDIARSLRQWDYVPNQEKAVLPSKPGNPVQEPLLSPRENEDGANT